MALRVSCVVCTSTHLKPLFFLSSLSHFPFSLSLSLDFAVGAPYEEDGDSTGVVYVYYGNSDLTLFENQTPVRVREGKGEREGRREGVRE